MALSQAHLDALDVAIASGQVRIVLDGKSIEYRSIGDMIKARRHIERMISAAPARTAPRYQTATFSDD